MGHLFTKDFDDDLENYGKKCTYYVVFLWRLSENVKKWNGAIKYTIFINKEIILYYIIKI